ncbi:MAG: hypothetical protein M3460_05855 [Actinomycetota bacterium]|nr:hypothetical protein [Actinomycetota bacterium]
MTDRQCVRWALSPVDRRAHLLLSYERRDKLLKARCGHLMPADAPVHDQPLGGPSPSAT